MAKHKDRDPTNSKPAAAVTALARGGTAASRDGSNSGVSSGGRNKGGRGRGRSLTGAITKPGRGRGRGDGVCSDLSAATEQPIVGKQVGTVKQPSAVKQLRKEQKQKQKQKQKQQWTKPKLPKQKQPQAGAENSGAQQALERMAQTLVSHPTEWQDHQPASPPVAGDRSSGRQPGSCPACGAAWLHDSSSGSTPRTSALSPGDWAFLQQLADKLERDRLDRITHQSVSPPPSPPPLNIALCISASFLLHVRPLCYCEAPRMALILLTSPSASHSVVLTAGQDHLQIWWALWSSSRQSLSVALLKTHTRLRCSTL